MKIFTLFLLRKFAHVLGKGMRNFAACEKGSPAVEFSLVLLPFLVLFFGIFETGIIYLKQMTVESATAVASRELRTGAAQQSNNALALFRDVLCREAAALDAVVVSAPDAGCGGVCRAHRRDCRLHFCLHHVGTANGY